MVSLTSQLSALRRLNSVDRDLRVLDKRLSTGVKVANTKDSTSVAVVARASKSLTTSLANVQSSLDLGIATVSTASSAAADAGGILGNIRDLLEAAKSGSADLASIQTQLTDQRVKLRSVVSGAGFKGVNLLASSTSLSGYLGASAEEAGKDYSIAVDRSRTRLLDTLGTTGILQTAFALTSTAPGSSGTAPSTLGLSGTATQTAGAASATPTTNGLSGTASSVAGQATNAVAPATTGLSGAATAVAGVTGVTPSTSGLSGTAATVSGVAFDAATAAKAYIGTYNGSGNSSGDTVHFTLNLNGVSKTIEVYQRTITNGSTLQTELQRAVDAQFGANQITARVESDNRISLQTLATGSGQSIAVTGVSVADGNDITTTTLGLTARADLTDRTGTVNGQTRVRDRLGVPDLSGIDKTDRLRFRIEGQILDANGNVTSSGAITVTVNLGSVTDAASLASAIDAAIQADATGRNYFGAALESGQVVVYHKNASAKIGVTAIDAIEGNGTIAGNLGFAAGSDTGTAAVSAVAASATTGSDFSAVTLQDGASLKFDLTVNGVVKSVTVNKATVENALTGQAGYTAGSGTIADINKFVLVAQRALTDAGVSNATATASGSRLKFTKSGTPADGDSVGVSNVTATSGTSTAATLTTGSDFTGPRTIAANASLNFTLTVDGTAKTIAVTKTDVEAALNNRAGHTNGSGTIADAAEFALVVQAAMTRQSVAGVTVAADGSKLKFTKTAVGNGSLAISGVAGASTATNAIATTGSDFTSAITVADDGALTFDIAVDGGATKTIRIGKATVEAALAGVSGRTSGSGRIASVAELATVAQRALSDNGVAGITVGTSGNRLTFTRTAAGAGSVALGNIQAVASTATAATLKTGSDFAGPVTIEPGASIGFDLGVDGGAAKRATIQQSTVEMALSGVAGRTSGTGTIANVAEFALVVQQALVEAGVGGIATTVDGNRIKLAKTATGAGQIAISGVSAVAASVSAPSSTTIDSINLNGAGFRALSGGQQTALLDDYIANIEGIAKQVEQAGSYLGFVGRQLAIQSAHTGKLQGIEKSRVSSMVDADMDAEKARRSALEARLALARKSIEIVNQSRRSALDIFGSSQG